MIKVVVKPPFGITINLDDDHMTVEELLALKEQVDAAFTKKVQKFEKLRALFNSKTEGK